LAPRSYPKISYFTAAPSTIKLGEKSTLSWEVHNTTKVEIDVGIGLVDSNGSIEVSPSETTHYTLTAWNQEYNYEHQALVTVWETATCTVTVE
jgi:hypothetical protein